MHVVEVQRGVVDRAGVAGTVSRATPHASRSTDPVWRQRSRYPDPSACRSLEPVRDLPAERRPFGGAIVGGHRPLGPTGRMIGSGSAAAAELDQARNLGLGAGSTSSASGSDRSPPGCRWRRSPSCPSDRCRRGWRRGRGRHRRRLLHGDRRGALPLREALGTRKRHRLRRGRDRHLLPSLDVDQPRFCRVGSDAVEGLRGQLRSRICWTTSPPEEGRCWNRPWSPAVPVGQFLQPDSCKAVAIATIQPTWGMLAFLPSAMIAAALLTCSPSRSIVARPPRGRHGDLARTEPTWAGVSVVDRRGGARAIVLCTAPRRPGDRCRTAQDLLPEPGRRWGGGEDRRRSAWSAGLLGFRLLGSRLPASSSTARTAATAAVGSRRCGSGVPCGVNVPVRGDQERIWPPRLSRWRVPGRDDLRFA